MDIKVYKGSCLDFSGDVVILFHFSDVKPLIGDMALLDWRCNAAVSILLKRKPDLFKFGQLTILATQGKLPTETAILTGLGTRDALDPDLRREAGRVALEAALKLGAKKVAVDGSPLSGVQEGIAVDDIKGFLGNAGERQKIRIALYSGRNRQQPPSVEEHHRVDGAV